MTRGNPRPGQQQMPDRSDVTERAAQKIKARTTKASGEVRDEAADQLPEAPRAGPGAGKKPGKGRRRATKAPR